MYIKIYFNNKPLFLCDSIDSELEPYRHHDDTMFIDEFSTHALKSMIHEMEQAKIHAGILYHPDLEALKKAFWKKFTVIQAAGGMVLNAHKETLMIFRRGKWDLPKGKLERGEKMEECALREVEEETGLKSIHIDHFLLETHHTYHESGKFFLKESHWYLMKTTADTALVPQKEEDIAQAVWAEEKKVTEYLKNSFPSIVDVINLYRRQESPAV
jgi:8-oxo-dGTP pyrophosphatase MutT (NUDIX family)